MLKEFRSFILRGNVVELAVAVVIGAAFGAVVTSFVENILTPLIAIPGTVNFSNLEAEIGGGTFRYGLFLNAVIAFLMIAAAVFFFVVKPLNAIMSRLKTEEPTEEPTRDCPHCLSSVPVAASRCAFCTSELTVG